MPTPTLPFCTKPSVIAVPGIAEHHVQFCQEVPTVKCSCVYLLPYLSTIQVIWVDANLESGLDWTVDWMKDLI